MIVESTLDENELAELFLAKLTAKIPRFRALSDIVAVRQDIVLSEIDEMDESLSNLMSLVPLPQPILC